MELAHLPKCLRASSLDVQNLSRVNIPIHWLYPLAFAWRNPTPPHNLVGFGLSPETRDTSGGAPCYNGTFPLDDDHREWCPPMNNRTVPSKCPNVPSDWQPYLQRSHNIARCLDVGRFYVGKILKTINYIWNSFRHCIKGGILVFLQLKRIYDSKSLRHLQINLFSSQGNQKSTNEELLTNKEVSSTVGVKAISKNMEMVGTCATKWKDQIYKRSRLMESWRNKKKEGVGCKKTWMRTTQREGEKKTFNHMVQRDHSGEIRQGWRWFVNRPILQTDRENFKG